MIYNEMVSSVDLIISDTLVLKILTKAEDCWRLVIKKTLSTFSDEAAKILCEEEPILGNIVNKSLNATLEEDEHPQSDDKKLNVGEEKEERNQTTQSRVVQRNHWW